MAPFYAITLIVAVVCAVFFYRAGQFEGTCGWGWAALSVVISLVIWQGLRGGPIAVLLGQVGLYVGITVYRVWKKS